jgi:hypothetical protein
MSDADTAARPHWSAATEAQPLAALRYLEKKARGRHPDEWIEREVAALKEEPSPSSQRGCSEAGRQAEAGREARRCLICRKSWEGRLQPPFPFLS